MPEKAVTIKPVLKADKCLYKDVCPNLVLNPVLPIHALKFVLSELNKVEAEIIDLAALREANLVIFDSQTSQNIWHWRLKEKITFVVLRITKGARASY